MKKLLFVCVALTVSLLFLSKTNAQPLKIGYLDEQAVLQLMPGFGRVDTLMYSFQNDSLRQEYEYRVGEYQRQDSIFKKDSATMPPKARELAMRDLGQKRVILINWQEYAQQMYNAKQDQLVTPFRIKLKQVVDQVVAEQKYTLVLNQSAVSVYGPVSLLDNISVRVAIKMKLPLPKDIEEEWKRLNGTGTPAPVKKN